MMTKRNWELFHRWEDEQLAKSLSQRTHAQALRWADELYAHALQLSPATVRHRPSTADEWLAADDIQSMMRVRRVFEAHASRST